MPGILPEQATAGGIVYRDAAGAPTNPPNVQNAYPPAPAFLSTCLLTALPSDCTARIEAKQINAIVSEMLSFAECMNPTGTWDCNSLQNLCAAFSQWIINNMTFVYVGTTPPGLPKDARLWWESDTGNLYLRYNDGNSVQWVQVNATNEVVVDNISIVGEGVSGDPYMVGLVDCGAY